MDTTDLEYIGAGGVLGGLVGYLVKGKVGGVLGAALGAGAGYVVKQVAGGFLGQIAKVPSDIGNTTALLSDVLSGKPPSKSQFETDWASALNLASSASYLLPGSNILYQPIIDLGRSLGI